MKRLSFLDTLSLWIGRIILALLVWFAFIQIGIRMLRRYKHFPAPPFIAAFLDSPIRKAMQPPEEIVTQVGIKPGMTVLELGPGPGTFTIEAARRVLPGGKVIAVDIEPRMLARLRDKAVHLGVNNLQIHQSDAYHLPVSDASIDLAFMVTVLAEIPDRARALAELRRVLRPGGILSVSELVTDPDYPRQSTVIRWCQTAGFRHESSHNHLLWYIANFRKPQE